MKHTSASGLLVLQHAFRGVKADPCAVQASGIARRSARASRRGCGSA